MSAKFHKKGGFAGLAAVVALAGMTAVDAAAQGANCQSFTTAAQITTGSAATPNVCAFDSTLNANSKSSIKHVLLMDWRTQNGGHDRGHTQRHMLRLSRKYGFKLDRSQQDNYITSTTLQGVDIVAFNNGDQDPLQNTTALAAMRNFVEVQGRGMMAIHASLAYMTCPSEDLSNSTCKWFLRAYRTQFYQHNPHQTNTAARIYVDSVRVGELPPNAIGNDAQPSGGNHGWRNDTLKNIFLPIADIADQSLPVNGGTGPLATSALQWEGGWDEWYNYRNHPRTGAPGVFGGVNYGRVHILISLDETTQPANVACNGGTNCKTGDRAISWTRRVGLGLAAYNNAGHGDAYTRTRTVNGMTMNDSLWEKYNWRLLKYLNRDYVGCMTPGDDNFNPQASVVSLSSVDAEPMIGGLPNPLFRGCVGNTSIRHLDGNKSALSGLNVVGNRVSIPTDRQGNYRVAVTTLNGRQVFFRAVQGGAGRKVEVDGLSKGLYMVRVKTPDQKTAIARVSVR